MKSVRIGIIGIGSMGTNHVRYLTAGVIDGAQLTAVATSTQRVWIGLATT